MLAELRRATRGLGNVHSFNRNWLAAAEAYKQSLQVAELIYQASPSLSGQEYEISENKDLIDRAAYAHAKAGDLQAAVVILENGWARELRTILERDRSDLSDLEKDAPMIYQRYRKAAENLRLLRSEERLRKQQLSKGRNYASSEEYKQRVRNIHEEFESAIAEVRQQPGYAAFLSVANFSDIATAVKPDRPIVYLLSNSNGSVALIVHSPEKSLNSTTVTPVFIDGLSGDAILNLFFGSNRKEAIGGWLDAYDNQSVNRAGRGSFSATFR